MEIDTLFGLPAHPLIVPAAVVLLPIAAIGLIVVALVPKLRRHYAPVVFGVALAATIAVGATWMVIGVGHSGATSVWIDTTKD